MSRYRFAAAEPELAVAGVPVRVLALGFAGILGGLVAQRLAAGLLSLGLFFGVAIAAVVGSFLRPGGRSPERWLLVWARYQLRRRRPVSLGNVVEIRRDPETGAGLVATKSSGESLATVLEVPGVDFQLLSPDEQSQVVAEWGRVLAARAGEAPRLRRLQVLQILQPEANDQELEHLGRRGDRSSPFYADYAALRKEEPWQLRRRTFLVLQVWASDVAAAARLRSEVAAVSTAMAAIFGKLRPLSATETACVIRGSADPLQADGAGPVDSELSDLVLEERADRVGCNTTFHRMFKVAAWPAAEVGGEFLQPLLLDLRQPHAFALCLEPMRHSAAVRRLDARQASQLSDVGLRDRGGFLDSAGRRRRREDGARQSEELASGEQLFIYSGWLRLSADSLAALDAATADVQAIASRSGLSLRGCRYRQLEAMLATLPDGGGSR